MGEPAYTVVRSRRKTAALSIDRSGALTVRAPERADSVWIDALVRRHADWIEKKQALIAAENAAFPPFTFREGAPLPYLGQTLALTFADCPAVAVRCGALLLPLGSVPEELIAWLRGQAQTLLAERTASFAEVMGVSFQSVSVTGARTRWGSCSAADRLSFTWRLIFCEPAAIDYVVVHELAHIEHKNHGAAFWARVQGVLPGFVEQRDWLKRHGRLLQIL